MRALAAASVLLAASGCCVDLQPDDACVVDRLGGRPYCYELVHDRYACWDGEERLELASLPHECEGTFHAEDDCADHGYTVRCGSYWITPHDRC